MELKQILETLWKSELYKVILSNPAKKSETEYQKMVCNRLSNGWQVEKYTFKQVFHENLSEEELKTFLQEKLCQVYRQCNAWDQEREHSIRISKGGKVMYQKKKSTQAPKEKTGHNRKKNYILEEGKVIPPLVDMGIFTAEGKVVRCMINTDRSTVL